MMIVMGGGMIVPLPRVLNCALYVHALHAAGQAAPRRRTGQRPTDETKKDKKQERIKIWRIKGEEGTGCPQWES